MNKMRVMITGSSGFIGRNVTKVLENENLEIIKVSRSEGYNLVNWSQVSEIVKCDVIIHLAANTFVPDSFNNPREYYENNISATLNVLELARVWDSRLIYLSSYCYGAPQYIPVDEKHPINPHNPYSQSKWISEELCIAYCRDFDLSVIAFRLFNVYGPNQTGSFLIPEILDQIKRFKNVVLKDPRPKRDYIHIDDVVLAIHKAINMNLHGFNEFNLGTGESIDVKTVVDIIKHKSKIQFDVNYTHEYRKGEVLESVADVSKLKKHFNWAPTIHFDEGSLSLL